MANNKVQLADGSVLIDLTSDTVTAAALRSGYTAHDAAGNVINGALEVDPVYSVTKSLTNVITTNDDTKVIAGNSFHMDFIPDNGMIISSVIVMMGGVDITSQVFTPGTGTKTITANGTYSASEDGLSGYEQVVVNVPSTSPSLGTKTITENGTYNASSDSLDGYSSVTVNIPGSSPTFGTKTITANGTYNASSDSLDGYTSVTVAIPSASWVSF